MRPADRYRAFLLDLDGVVYRADQVVAGAPEAVASLREAGRVVFLTNNSARTPEQVAEKLGNLGVEASPEEIVTSAQATADVVARRAGEDSRPATAFVVGERGIRQALAERGVRVLDGDPAEAGFVVVGWDRSADYDRLRTASVLVGRGAHLVATNADASYPAPGDDLWPGAGALLAAVETATGTTAEVVGKPHRPLFDAAVDRAGTRSALMVGDRIETDVVGAADAGLDSALVLTGAARAATLLDRGPPPTILAEDLAGLLVERPDARIRDAAPDDGPAISALLEAASLDPSEDGEGTVVAGDGDVVATAAADVRGPEAYLRSVAVREEARGQRFGVLVSWAAIRDAARRGARRAFLLTETAEGFFARLGFEAVDRSEVPGWILERTARCSESAAAMARDLRA